MVKLPFSVELTLVITVSYLDKGKKERFKIVDESLCIWHVVLLEHVRLCMLKRGMSANDNTIVTRVFVRL